MHYSLKSLNFNNVYTEVLPQDANHREHSRTERPDWTSECIWKFLLTILWSDETKMNLQNDRKWRVWRRNDPKHTTSSVKHSGCRIMAWASMAASDIGTLVFVDAVTVDRNSRINSEAYGTYAAKLIKQHFTLQIDNDPKCTPKRHPRAS